MEENTETLFYIDTQKDDGEDINKLFSDISIAAENYKINEDNEDPLGLLSSELTINEILDKCPIKAEYFASKKADKEKKPRKFKDKFLQSLGDYLDELSAKKYEFVTDGIEAKHDISRLGMSERQIKKLNRKEREKTKGSKWFNMKAPEMTEELKNDLQILQMRSALDPKHFYKRSEMKALPKYFEIGHVVDSPVEYHNSKNIRKRNKTLVDELMEDAEFQKFNKKKYQESMAEKQKQPHFKKFKKSKKV